MELQIEQIQANLITIKERIANAAYQAGRNLDDIKLVVVTKAQPAEVINSVVQAGAEILGENYAEEAFEKQKTLGNRINVLWHMIGHVQSRKARLVAEHFDWIHSVDSIRIAQKYNEIAAGIGKTLPILLEINVGGEETKFGWTAEKPNDIEKIIPDIERIATYPHLEIRGLMTMPPLFEDGNRTRPYFRRLRLLQEILAKRMPNQNWQELSMGTSSDFEEAILEGATFVRIGRAILGPRPDNIEHFS
jgi:pyridoxal phosphate enzyme (YggS family)